MRNCKNPIEMDADEFEEYAADVMSGYAYDPDGKVLESDKSISVKDLFTQLSAEIDSSSSSSFEDFMKTYSRYLRISEWIKEKIVCMNASLQDKLKQRTKEYLLAHGADFTDI